MKYIILHKRQSFSDTVGIHLNIHFTETGQKFSNSESLKARSTISELLNVDCCITIFSFLAELSFFSFGDTEVFPLTSK